jgi:hypothetical protein
MDFQQKFTLNPDYKVEEFDNEVLLYSVRDSKGVYLNVTACVVWELCHKCQSVEEIVTLLEEVYPQQKAAIREDVVLAIESLVENGALVATDE